MSAWEQRLLVATVIVVVTNMKNWRGLILVGLMVCNYIATTAWYAYNLPNHATATALADSAVAVYAILSARYNWEVWFGRIFVASTLCSLLKIAGILTDQGVYALALEICNWLGLFVIGSVGVMRLIGDGALGKGNPSRGLVRFSRVVSRAEARHYLARRK